MCLLIISKMFIAFGENKVIAEHTDSDFEWNTVLLDIFVSFIMLFQDHLYSEI